MNMAIGAIISAIRRLWVPIVIIAAASIVWGILRAKNSEINDLTAQAEQLEMQNTKILDENRRFEHALEAARESTEKQIKALEAEAAESATRQTQYIEVIKEVENTNEKVECSVPGFMRDAFERM